jgi:hypothetical protein
MTWPHKIAGTASALALVAAAGCGGNSTDNSSDGAAAAADTPAVTITSPQAGAKVGSAFPVKFQTSVPIGALESGKDHVHVVVDGDTNNFTVVTAHQTMVKNLSPGKHTIGVTLQHADHSSAGAQDQVTVMVAKGGATKSGTMKGSTSGNSSGNPYGRGY